MANLDRESAASRLGGWHATILDSKGVRGHAANPVNNARFTVSSDSIKALVSKYASARNRLTLGRLEVAKLEVRISPLESEVTDLNAAIENLILNHQSHGIEEKCLAYAQKTAALIKARTDLSAAQEELKKVAQEADDTLALLTSVSDLQQYSRA